MPTPTATTTTLTATGDVIVTPGSVTELVKGMPIVCMGDMVAGPVCVTGVITTTLKPNSIYKGRPVASVACVVAGVSPVGVPVSTALAVSVGVNELK